MNIVVFGPEMESRSLPSCALRPVERVTLTALEFLVQRIGRELYSKDPVDIVGVPWVNPRGRGRAYATIDDYLNDPLSLYRALEVAFNAPVTNFRADGAVIVSEMQFREQLLSAQEWVMRRFGASSVCERIVWYTFDPGFAALLVKKDNEQTAATLRNLVGNHALPSSIPGIVAFSDSLRSVFQ